MVECLNTGAKEVSPSRPEIVSKDSNGPGNGPANGLAKDGPADTARPAEAGRVGLWNVKIALTGGHVERTAQQQDGNVVTGPWDMAG